MNQIVLVTGASSGIGEELCRECVAKGWHVIGVARSQDKLLALQTKLGQEIFYPLICDVADTTAVHLASDRLIKSGLIPTIFFLNAGIAGEPCVEDSGHFDLEKHRDIMAVNYFGALAWLEFWQTICQENGGATFVATSSVNALWAPPTASAYAASKAALAKAFEGLAATYVGTTLRFLVIYPGPVATKGLKGSFPFTWHPKKMAKYMIQCALKGKYHCEPQLFYSILTRILRVLPYNWVDALLNRAIK
jgi:3-hydroxy acid dehydrogenase/malonic semialdehyde reductase